MNLHTYGEVPNSAGFVITTPNANVQQQALTIQLPMPIAVAVSSVQRSNCHPHHASYVGDVDINI